MEKHYEELRTKEGFEAEFFRMVQEYPTYQEAYEAVERKHKAAYGRRRYKNYNSYQTVRSRKK